MTLKRIFRTVKEIFRTICRIVEFPFLVVVCLLMWMTGADDEDDGEWEYG